MDVPIDRFQIGGFLRRRHQGEEGFRILAVQGIPLFGDVFALFAVALAIVTTARWIYRDFAHRVARNDAGSEAELSRETHLRPALTVQDDLKKTSAHAPWSGHRAA